MHYHPTPRDFITRPLPALFPGVSAVESNVLCNQSIEKNMDFNSRVTFNYVFATTFSRKTQKTKKPTEFKIYFSIFSMKEASVIKKYGV
jgi:hypothetical protein